MSLDQVSLVLGEQDPALYLHLCSFQCLKGHRAGRRVKSPEGGQRPHLRQYRGSLREAQRLGLSATHLGPISTSSHPSALYSPLAPSEISVFFTSREAHPPPTLTLLLGQWDRLWGTCGVRGRRGSIPELWWVQRTGETVPQDWLLVGEGLQKDPSRAHPVIQRKGWKGPKETCQSPKARPVWGGAGVPTSLPSLPMLCLSLQTVNIGVVTSLIKASVSLKNMESG